MSTPNLLSLLAISFWDASIYVLYSSPQCIEAMINFTPSAFIADISLSIFL